MYLRITLYWGGEEVYAETCRRTATSRLSLDDRIQRAVRDVRARVKFPFDQVVVTDATGQVLRRDRGAAA